MPTLIQLETEVRNILDEPTAAQWSQSQLRQWLNEGNRDLARFTRHYKSTATFVCVAGVSEYTLNSSIIAVEHAYYDDGSRKTPLQARAYENMDNLWGWDQDRAGAPAFYTTWGYAPTLKFKMFPVPTSNTDSVNLLTSVIPADMPLAGSDSSNVDVPPAWYDALADYCEYKALRKDRAPEAKDAYMIYQQKRDEMLNLDDYTTATREVVPDPMVGYLPRWLVEFE